MCLDEDGAVESCIALSEDVGTIDVKIWPTRVVNNISGKIHVQKSHAADEGIKLSEKSKLIGANHVKCVTLIEFRVLSLTEYQTRCCGGLSVEAKQDVPY